jgi:phosphoglycolate phosphatase-like HAD superfamily hydrolase
VWDWNGTLFDDLHIVLKAVNASAADLGLDPIGLDVYRAHYTRPVSLFYERLAGRRIAESEWTSINDRFHDVYRTMIHLARPNESAHRALDLVRSAGIPQSILSMAPHDDLVELVHRLALTDYFDRIDGLRGDPGDAKAAYLEAHLRDLIGATQPAEVLVVGDTPDDATAAAHVGANCVLYDNGSHHRSELEGLGVPVVDSLFDAVDRYL